jgi:hypothetical protein
MAVPSCRFSAAALISVTFRQLSGLWPYQKSPISLATGVPNIRSYPLDPPELEKTWTVTVLLSLFAVTAYY